MFGRFRHKRSARFTGGLAVGLLVLCALFTAGARAQSAPPPKPSGSINIHQVQVAFIGSGAVGGGTLHFRGRSYPFKLGGLGIGGSTLDATGPCTTFAVFRISRGFTARRKSDGPWASRVKARCGCKMGMGVSASEGAARRLGL